MMMMMMMMMMMTTTTTMMMMVDCSAAYDVSFEFLKYVYDCQDSDSL
jgi:hypothetical protein